MTTIKLLDLLATNNNKRVEFLRVILTNGFSSALNNPLVKIIATDILKGNILTVDYSYNDIIDAIKNIIYGCGLLSNNDKTICYNDIIQLIELELK